MRPDYIHGEIRRTTLEEEWTKLVPYESPIECDETVDQIFVMILALGTAPKSPTDARPGSINNSWLFNIYTVIFYFYFLSLFQYR
jgi:hypothetical protein